MNILQTLLIAHVLVGAAASASPVTFNSPDLDRWMYPFNGTPGTRSTGSTFGAVGSAGFDDRDAQFLIGFNTAGVIAPGQGASNYLIHGAVLTLTHSGGSFVYDPTRDGHGTYTTPATDTDAGRPIELFGVGYRGGFSAASFTETTPFSFGAPAESVRLAYALGGGVDVSNSVAEGFDPVPYAIGEAVGLAPGDTVVAGTEIRFQLDLSSPEVLAYLRSQLDSGSVNLMATSLHPASFGGPAQYPSFDTKENLVGTPGSLELDVQVIPEPSALLLLGAGLLALRWWALRRRG